MVGTSAVAEGRSREFHTYAAQSDQLARSSASVVAQTLSWHQSPVAVRYQPIPRFLSELTR